MPITEKIPTGLLCGRIIITVYQTRSDIAVEGISRDDAMDILSAIVDQDDENGD